VVFSNRSVQLEPINPAPPKITMDRTPDFFIPILVLCRTSPIEF